MASIWKRVFRRKDYISESVERAIEAQSAFETTHPIPFAPDLRERALIQRLTIVMKGQPPAPALALIKQAAAEWAAARRAAEQTP